MEVLFCLHCGAKLVENARFCVKCGNPVPRLEETEEPVVPVAVEASETPEVQTEASEMQHETPEAQPEIPEVQTETLEVQHEVSEVQPVIPASRPAKKKERAPRSIKKRRGVGRTLVAVLLCVLLFLLSAVTVLLTGVQSLTTENGVKALVGDVVDEVDCIPASLFSKEAGEDDSVIDLVVDLAQKNGMKFKKRDLEKLLTDSEFVDVVSEEIYAYISDIRSNGKKAVLDEKDIRNLLKDHDDLIEDTLGLSMSDRVRKDAAENAEKSGVLEYTNARLLKQKVPAVYYGIQYGLSIWVLCILGGLLLLFVILLASVNRWDFVRTTGDLGTTLAAAGALITVPSAVGMLGVESLLGSLPAAELICVVVEHLTRYPLLGALSALGLGVVLLLLSKIVKMIAAKRQTKVAV